MKKTVPESLKDLAKIYEERNAVYGDNYKHAGAVLLGLFPRGVTLNTVTELSRFSLLIHVISKLGRYCQCIERGEVHADSLDDSAVYLMMMREIDDEDT